jgi:hypothetical protein
VNESERIPLEEVLGHSWMLDNCNNGFDSNLRRTDSEETIVEDDDAIVMNDDEFKNENRDETRSNDDSSSGIVMSDRNEGSSVSHEEIDPVHIIFENNDEEMPQMIEEQIEPENLSLKTNINSDRIEEKLLDDEPTVEMPPEEELTVEEIPQSKQRAAKKSRSRVVKQKATTEELHEISPLDLHTPKIQIQPDTIQGLPLNLVVETEEEFFGFELVEIENDNFPLFGFENNGKPDIMSNTLLKFKPLFDYIEEKAKSRGNKVLTVAKAQRVRKNNLQTVQSKIELPRIEVVRMLPTKYKSVANIQVNQKAPTATRSRAAKQETKKQIAPPPPSTRPVRNCRILKEAEKAAEIEKAKALAKAKKTANESAKIEQKSRATKRSKPMPEQEIPAKRTRKAIKQEKNEEPLINNIIQMNEVGNKSRSRRKIEEVMPLPQSVSKNPPTRAQKRKAIEPPKKVIAEKKPRKAAVMIKKEVVESPSNVRVTRRRHNNISEYTASQLTIPKKRIKLEQNSSIELATYHQRSHHNLASNSSLSPQFKRRLNSIKTSYVDNKQHPSLISPQFVKPERVEKATINIFTQPLRTQYR